MQKIVLFSQLMLAAFALASCNKSLTDTLVKNYNVQKYSYQFTENGCTTGEKSFSSLSEMCTNLKSDSNNNFCAYGLRKSKFESDCFSQGVW